MEDCVFCKIVKGEVKAEIMAESNSFIAFKDANPKVPGHVLVVPKNHYVTLLDIPSKMGIEMLEFTKSVVGELLDNKIGDGFNLVMNNLEVAGQVVPHAHIHILPRKEGDGFKLIG